MPVTGKFDADFASFYDACTKAEISLRGFESSTGKVETSLNRMVDSFSGRKIITEATELAEVFSRFGGTSQLTNAELARVGATAAEAAAKFRALGQEVPAGIQKLAEAAQRAVPSVNNLHGALNQFDGVLAAMGVHLGPEIRGLGELGDAAGKNFSQLGLLATAGLAVGAAMGGWKIGRAIAEFFELDKAIANATATLMGWGDVSAEAAGAKADTLAKASATAGRSITDMKEAIEINNRSFNEWNDALRRARGPEESRLQIEHWNQELDKVVKAGVLKALTADLESHNFSVKDLAHRYGISTEALAFFTKELKDDAAAAGVWAKEQTDAARAAAAAHKAAVEVELAELKIMDEFRQVAHKRQTEIVRIQTDQQTSAAKVVNAAVLSEFEAQTKLNAEWGRNAAGALSLQHSALDTLNLAMDELHRHRVEGISQTQQEQVLINAYTKQLYDEAVAHDRVSGAVVGQIGTVNALTGAYALLNAVVGSGPDVPNSGRNERGAPIDRPKSAFSLGGPFTLTPPVVSSHKDGGPVNAGPAMLHDNEYVVPSGGALVSRGGGGTTNVTIHVNGTAEDVARKISAEIWRRVGKKVNA